MGQKLARPATWNNQILTVILAHPVLALLFLDFDSRPYSFEVASSAPVFTPKFQAERRIKRKKQRENASSHSL